MAGTPKASHGSLDLMTRLEQLYSRGGLTPGDVAAMIVASELESVGADAAFVATVVEDGRTLEVARVTPYSAHPVRLAFPVDARYPLAEAVRSGRSLFIASNEQLSCDHPGLLRLKEQDHACATMPLLRKEGELIGALNLGFEDPHEFTDEERVRIARIAEECADALAAALDHG